MIARCEINGPQRGNRRGQRALFVWIIEMAEIKKPEIIDLQKERDIQKITQILRTWTAPDVSWFLQSIQTLEGYQEQPCEIPFCLG